MPDRCLCMTQLESLIFQRISKYLYFGMSVCSPLVGGGGGGYPIPGLGEGYHILLMGGGGTSSQVWIGGRYPIPGSGAGVPHSRSGWGGGYLIPGLDGGYPVPGFSGDQGWRTPPPPRTEWVTPPTPNQETEQHSEHLLRGGRYASCVHTGGLCCLVIYLLKCNCSNGKITNHQNRYVRSVFICTTQFVFHMQRR